MQNSSLPKPLRKTVLLLALVLAGATVATAQDIATFVNLGFSDNSRVFMFGQYGIQRESGNPYAEIYTVDVPGNVFVSGGVFTQSYDHQLSPGQDGLGALFKLFSTAASTVRSHSIDHLRQGRLIYLLVNGEEPRTHLEFRDFETGSKYRMSLVQRSRGEGPDGEAAFYIDLDITFANGAEYSGTVGRPQYFRDGVNEYQIKKVLVSPDERSLVIVVEKITNHAAGNSIRYMVETVTVR